MNTEYKEEVTITITEKHLDKAVEETKENCDDWTCHCILAQAAKDVFPNLAGTGFSNIRLPYDPENRRTIVYEAKDPQPLREIIMTFDWWQYNPTNLDKIRKQLPLTIEYKLNH